MTLAADQIRSFAGDAGGVYVADVGTAEPADADAALGAGWTHLGHIPEDSIKIALGKARTPLVTWQSFPHAARNLKAAATSTIAFGLEQWNPDTLDVALGGGSWTTDGSGLYTYTPPADTETNEKAIAIEGYDGDTFYRFIFRRTENEAGVEIGWSGTTAAALPTVMTMLKPDGDEDNFIIQVADANITVGS